MKTILKMFARLDSITQNDGTPWDEGNRRLEVVGRLGCVYVGESERRYPGNRMAEFRLMAWKEDDRWCGCMPDAYWRTSYGVSEVTPSGLVMRTSYSIYRFTMLQGDEVDEYLKVWGLTREKFETILRDADEKAGPWKYVFSDLEKGHGSEMAGA